MKIRLMGTLSEIITAETKLHQSFVIRNVSSPYKCKGQNAGENYRVYLDVDFIDEKENEG